MGFPPTERRRRKLQEADVVVWDPTIILDCKRSLHFINTAGGLRNPRPQTSVLEPCRQQRLPVASLGRAVAAGSLPFRTVPDLSGVPAQCGKQFVLSRWG